MTLNKDDYASHMDSITDITVKILTGDLPTKWPTVLSIFQDVFMNPDKLDWAKDAGITEKITPAAGDSYHWYKVKNNLKENFTRAADYILKKGNHFVKSDNDLFNSASNVISTKNVTYFVVGSALKACPIKGDISQCKDITVEALSGSDIDFGNIVDALSIETTDYILCTHCILRYDTTQTDTNKAYKILVSNTDTCNAFAAIQSVIVVATSAGGVRIAGISGSNPAKTNITRKEKTVTSSSSSSSSSDSSASSQTTSTTYTNGVPSGACTYVYPKGSKYYIGNSSTCGEFDINATSFEPDTTTSSTTTEDKHEPYLTGKSKNTAYGVCGPKDGKYLVADVEYSISDANCVYSTDSYVVFGTSAGLKVFTKAQSNGLYGPESCLGEFNSFEGSVTNIGEINGVLYVIGSNGKYKSTDETDKNCTIYLFNTDYDADVLSGKTDIKQAHLGLIKLIDLATPSGAVYDKYLKKANNGDASYAIIIMNTSDGHKCFITLGNDNRNATAVEGKDAMGAFDIGV